MNSRDVKTIEADIKTAQAEVEAHADARSVAERAMRAAKKKLDNLREELLTAYRTAPPTGKAK